MSIAILEDRDRGCFVDYDSAFLDTTERAALFEHLSAAPFESEVANGHRVRRQSVAYSDHGLVYRYAGVERRGLPWTPLLQALRDRLRRVCGQPFNFLLVNLYPDGQAGLGWHADDEPEIYEGSTIASISLGEEREFQIRLGREAHRSILLERGSLLLMRGNTQKHYFHQIPRSHAKDPRINLTFRRIRAPRALMEGGGYTAFVAAQFNTKDRGCYAVRICSGKKRHDVVRELDAVDFEHVSQQGVDAALRMLEGKTPSEVVCITPRRADPRVRAMRWDGEQAEMNATIKLANERLFRRDW